MQVYDCGSSLLPCHAVETGAGLEESFSYHDCQTPLHTISTAARHLYHLRRRSLPQVKLHIYSQTPSCVKAGEAAISPLLSAAALGFRWEIERCLYLNGAGDDGAQRRALSFRRLRAQVRALRGGCRSALSRKRSRSLALRFTHSAPFVQLPALECFFSRRELHDDGASPRAAGKLSLPVAIERRYALCVAAAAPLSRAGAPVRVPELSQVLSSRVSAVRCRCCVRALCSCNDNVRSQ